VRGEAGTTLVAFYRTLSEELRTKPPEDLSRELPGLVDHVADLASAGDDLAVGVSFTKNHTGLDYSIHRINGERLAPEKEPVTDTHRYVRFTHPPDHHFDASALRARLMGAVARERKEIEQPTSRFADLWSDL